MRPHDKTFDLSGSIERSLVNFGFLSSSKVLMQFIHLFTLALITRELGPSLYGKMSVFLMVTQFVYLMTCSWTAVGYTRFATVRGGEGRPLSDVFWCRSLIVLILVFSVGLFAFFARSRILEYMGLPRPILLVAFFHLLSLVMTDYSRQMAQVTTQFKKLSAIQVIEKALILALVLIWGKDLIHILWIFIVSPLICRLWLGISLGGSLYMPFRLSASLCVKLTRFSYPFLLTSIGGFIFGWIDIAVIKHFAPLERVGIYSLAYSGLGTTEAVMLFMTTVLTPIFISLAHQNRGDLINRFTKRIFPQLAYLWGFMGLLLAPACLWLVPLIFGDAFSESARILVVLLLCFYFGVLNALCVPIFVGYDLVRKMVAINFGASMINLILDFALVPKMGIMGAAVATLCSYGSISVPYCLLVSRRFDLDSAKLALFFGMIGIQAALLMFFNGGLARIAVGLLVVFVYLLAGKHLAVFRAEDEATYAALNMPATARRVISYICRHHA